MRRNRIRPQLAGVVAEAVWDDDEAVDDAYARAVWSTLTEPGDSVAVRLVGADGAVRALRRAQSGNAAGLPDCVSREEFAKARERWQPRAGDVRDVLETAQRARLRLLTPTGPTWPAGLDDLGDHAPLCLWARGSTDLLDAPAPRVALVGARAATGYGEHVAGELASELCDTGVSIVSGAAYGIDGMAHRAALAAGGVTIAYLAGGAEKAYPAGHTDLLDQIERVGVIVSEGAPGSAPTRWRFLQRNRLIASASQATVVVEAGWRSGSLNTAGHAAALGRPLGAVPGPVTSAASQGCHRLLREYDAVCVTGASDVRELLGWDQGPSALGASADPQTTRVGDALSSRTARAVDEIARRSGLSTADVAETLAVLELTGDAVLGKAGWRRVS